MNVTDFLIDEECTMLEAMELIDKVSKKLLFVTRRGKFVAAISNGDIRRWILKKGSIEAKVKDIANYNPKFISEKDKSTAKEYMKSHFMEGLPIVDENGDIVSVLLLNDEEYKIEKHFNIPVVIMAGGLGTRLYPYTKILPKPLIPIGDIPIVEHIINRFKQNGCNQFHLVVNHKKNMIKAYFNEVDKDYSISYVDEDKMLGTGGGLSLLKNVVNSTFILSNCDILINEDYEKMYNHHKSQNNLITMVCSLKSIKIPYGVVEISETGEIESMKEKPEVKIFANTGLYIVESRVVQELEEGVAIGFPDVVERYKNAGERVGVYPISENNWMDMGQLDEMHEMRRLLEKEEDN